MQAWVWVGFLAFFGVSLAVGIRLLLLWRRSRQLPELLIGLGVLGIGPVGFGAMVAGGALIESGTAPDSAAVRMAFAFGYTAVFSGVLAKCVFNWRVYRPDSAIARGAVGLAALGLLVLMGDAIRRGFVPAETVGGFAHFQSGLQITALLWGSAEAFRYWNLMRRRQALGLADPVVTNRFFLWGFGAGAAAMGSAVGTIASVLTGAVSLQIPEVVATSSAHGMAAAIAMWLAFLPPAAYTRFIQSRATAPSAA